jgi:hypothetical protein
VPTPFHNFRFARHSGVIAKFTGPVLLVATLRFRGTACSLTFPDSSGTAGMRVQCSITFLSVYRTPIDYCDSWAQNSIQRYRRNLRGEMGSDIFCGAPADFRVIQAGILGECRPSVLFPSHYLRVIP